MGICDQCKNISPDAKLRQSGDLLCEKCEQFRVITLSKEALERQLRSSLAASAEGSTSDDRQAPAPCDQSPVSGTPDMHNSASDLASVSPDSPAPSGPAGTADQDQPSKPEAANRDKKSASKQKVKSRVTCIQGCKINPKSKKGSDY